MSNFRTEVRSRQPVKACIHCGEYVNRVPKGMEVGEMIHVISRKTDLIAQTAEQLLVLAYAHSRVHTELAKLAMEQFGDHGSLISGCVRDHFPVPVKDRLRDIALEVTRLLDESKIEWRKSGKHLRTWIRLKDQIVSRDGKGYYG